MHVVATAGHVDHGKSTLVRALTGMEPDRLEEERRRGLTIELGYAWTTLPSGERLAFVDVPGHERFLGTMLAGAGPAPAVMFVVAADEGWMPQSQEHLVALEALGVRHGLLVVTRSDLADPGPAIERARLRLAASGLGEAEALAVSGRTGQGLDELRGALDRLVAALPAPDPGAPVRLWIDRAFSVRGSGTVVTGTLPAGTVAAGDELALPGGPVRVRALECLKEQVTSVTGVARVALNLRGRVVPERGQALVTPGAWTDTALIDVRISPAGATGPGGRGGDDRPPLTAHDLPRRLTAHIGSAAVVCEVRPLGGEIVRLRLATPLPLHVGDVLLLRDPGRERGEVRVLAGASVLDVRPPALRRRGAARNAPPGWRRPGRTRPSCWARTGCCVRVICWRWGAPPGKTGVRRLARRPGVLVGAGGAARRGGATSRRGASAGAWNAGRGGPPRAGPARSAAGRGAREGTAGRGRRADRVRALRAARAGGPGRRAARRGAVRASLPGPGGRTAGRAGTGSAGAGGGRTGGGLLRVAEGIVLLPGADVRAAEVLARLPQPFTVSQARQALDTSRRVAVPLLEHLDRRGITERVDEIHRRCRNSKK
ncbi:SelB C-terminal domain-containing protein [Streptosporangium lutulentum]